MSEWLSTLGGIAMALFPPLAYSDQYVSICKKRNSQGFSTDIPGLLIVANVTRCIYWLGARFQVYLLVQSLLMIGAQFGILYVCLLYKQPSATTGSRSNRPFQLWQWPTFPSYLEFTALLILGHSILFLLLHKITFYIDLLGFIALGLEATLPLPQLLINYENKSTAGFRHTVLAGWFLGDAFKTVYYFVTPNNSLAFKACAVFQLSVDCCLLVQTFMYREQTRLDLQLQERTGPSVDHQQPPSLTNDPEHIWSRDEDQDYDEEETEPQPRRQGKIAGVAGLENLPLPHSPFNPSSR
ncbi:Any1p [Sporobolomyces koalae]|uniref:Any1p n=1 Tax=Sporobolomyces koalae TaxID=500713 RepID=UPI00318216C9